MIGKRSKRGFALSIWIGLIMFAGSLVFAVLLGKDLKRLYFTESYLFYEIMIVMVVVFFAGFISHGRPKGG